MKIETITVGMFGVNCYLIWQSSDSMALVVDPGADPELIETSLQKNGLDVAAYLITHGHVDHLSALAELVDARPAPVVMNQVDAAWAFGPDNQIAPFYPQPRSPGPIACTVQDGSILTHAGLRYSVIATPGHTPGGVCYYFEDAGLLFTGDTLFEGTVGRTDLAGGDEKVLRRSIARLQRLPGTTKILPGHGESSTLAMEFENNPFLNVPD